MAMGPGPRTPPRAVLLQNFILLRNIPVFSLQLSCILAKLTFLIFSIKKKLCPQETVIESVSPILTVTPKLAPLMHPQSGDSSLHDWNEGGSTPGVKIPV